ncbi:C2 domain [Phytophthora cactorum]|nr:C2 domain [Phytophthora cactorum]
MLGTDFKRVKNLWQTRIGRSKSNESACSQEDPNQETTRSVESQTPHTPALDADFHQYAMEHELQVTKPTTLDDATPVSPASSSTTSASDSSLSSSPEKSSSNPVTSMLRTFSDACVFPSIMNKPPPAPAATSSSGSISSSTSSTSSFSFASVSLTSALPPREAAENAINNVHNVCTRCRTSSISRGSPYGELVVVDILEARGLAIDRDETGTDLPFTVTMQLGCMSHKTKPADRSNCAVNERFVFWMPSSPTIDQRTVDIFVHGGDERDLGEVHLSLAMPVNEAFGDWFPLVCRADGLKHGSLRVAMRRLVLTSSPMVEAAKTLGKRKSCLSFCDSSLYGDLLPELWSCFPGNEPEVIPSSPPKEEDMSSKLGRLIGFQDVQRDVF